WIRQIQDAPLVGISSSRCTRNEDRGIRFGCALTVDRARTDVIRCNHPVVRNLPLYAEIPLMDIRGFHMKFEVDVEHARREYDVRRQDCRERIASRISGPWIIQAACGIV